MSMGYLVGDESPVVWRGLMVMKALQQLLHEVDWGGLDVLVLDLPPGTGDVQLSITQQIELAGAVIISTPQTLSLKDSIRGIRMFEKVSVPILGMVQNMSLFKCPCCGHEEHVFGKNGVLNACEELKIRFLGDIPLQSRIASDADIGKPTVVAEPNSEEAAAFVKIATEVSKLVNL
jgi:ATP-binding protein involved in chromosome partitioning